MEEGYKGRMRLKTASKQNSSFGLGNFHTGVVAGVGCAATDTSFFCTLSKFLSSLVQIVSIVFIFYAFYIIVWPILKSRFRFSVRR